MSALASTSVAIDRRTRAIREARALLRRVARNDRDPLSVARKVTAGALYPWPKPNDTTDPFRAYFPEDMPGHMAGLAAMVWERDCSRRVYVRTDASGQFTRQGLLDGIASHVCYQLLDRGIGSGVHDVYEVVSAFCGAPQ